MPNEEQPMAAGSLGSIIYEFFQFLDEVLHAFDCIVGNMEWRWRFCRWCHRYAGSSELEALKKLEAIHRSVEQRRLDEVKAEVERLQAKLSQAELAAHIRSKALDEQATTIARLRAELDEAK